MNKKIANEVILSLETNAKIIPKPNNKIVESTAVETVFLNPSLDALDNTLPLYTSSLVLF